MTTAPGDDVDERTAGGLVPGDDSDLLPNAAGDRERKLRRIAREAYRRGKDDA